MEIVLEKIISIWQQGTVNEYCCEFQSLFNKVKNSEEINEDYATYLFINGLNPEIGYGLMRFHNIGDGLKLEQAFSLARYQERFLNGILVNGSIQEESSNCEVCTFDSHKKSSLESSCQASYNIFNDNEQVLDSPYVSQITKVESAHQVFEEMPKRVRNDIQEPINLECESDIKMCEKRIDSLNHDFGIRELIGGDVSKKDGMGFDLMIQDDMVCRDVFKVNETQLGTYKKSVCQVFDEMPSKFGIMFQETIDQDVMFKKEFGSLDQQASSLDSKIIENDDSNGNEEYNEIPKEFRTEIKDSANSCHSIKKWNQIGCEVTGRLADGYAAAVMKVCSNSNYFFNNHMNLWKVESFSNHVEWYEIYELYQLMFKYKKGVRRWLVKWKRKNIVKQREELQELHLQDPQTSIRFNVIFLFCTHTTDYIIRVWIVTTCRSTINELSSIWEALSVTMFPRVEMSTYSTDEGGPIIVEVKESKNEFILDVVRLIIINQVRKVRVLRLADGKSPMFWLGSSCAIFVVPSVFSSGRTHDFTSNIFQLKVSYVDILIHLITTLRVTYIFVAKTVKQYVVDSCRTGPTTIVIVGYLGAPFIEVARQRIFVMGKRIKNGAEQAMMIENYEHWSWCFNMEILLNMDNSYVLASISLYGYFSSYCKLDAKVTEVGNLVWKSNIVGMIRNYMMLRMGQMIIHSCDLDEAQEFSKFGFDSFD